MATVEQLAKEQQQSNLVIDDKIRKSVARYVDLEKRVKALNEEKKNEREQMEKLGVHPRAYQDEVRNFKLYDEAERAAYMASRRRMQEVLAPAEKDLFAEEIDARTKRAAKRASKDGNKPRSEEELNAQTDSSDRSDPDAGGAKPQTPPEPPADPKTLKETVAEGDAVIAANVAELNRKDGPKLKVVGAEPGQMAPVPGTSMAPPSPPADEQAEGEAALNAGLTETKRSQSQIAAEKRAQAKLN